MTTEGETTSSTGNGGLFSAELDDDDPADGLTEPERAEIADPLSNNVQISNSGNAQIVGNNVIVNQQYRVSFSDSTEKKVQIARLYLENGVPGAALELFDELIAREENDAEVRFYRVLALLSGRGYRDLSSQEKDEIARLPGLVAEYPHSTWKIGLEIIHEFLECIQDKQKSAAPALARMGELWPSQRRKMVRHLSHVLVGSVKDALWADMCAEARKEQLAGDRAQRVRYYFMPEPVAARAKQAEPPSVSLQEKVQAGVASAILFCAMGVLGWVLFQHPDLLGIASYLMIPCMGFVAGYTGFQWFYQALRLRSYDEYYSSVLPPPTHNEGFANQVTRVFNYYFGRYVPPDLTRQRWLRETAGLRASLRNEIVTIYREQRTSVDHVRWLIRRLASNARTQWKEGTFWSCRDQLQAKTSTKIWSLCSLLVLALCVVGLAAVVLHVEFTFSLIALASALVSGQVAALRWGKMLAEYKRYEDDKVVVAERQVWREQQHEAWTKKLHRLRPTEAEMETWLCADRTLILEEALAHYKISWTDVIAHAFLLSPATPTKRARSKGGPWRYTDYRVHAFLLSRDGVREVQEKLDFTTAERTREDRRHFRFDAVSEVRVSTDAESNYLVQLTLMNGDPRTIQVTAEERELGPQWGEQDATEYLAENPAMFERMSLDVSGFSQALHVLEGIAADGKGWVSQAFSQP